MILEILAYISVGIITLSWIIALITGFSEKISNQKTSKEQVKQSEGN